MKSKGFTLIELIVVVAILMTFTVAYAPDIAKVFGVTIMEGYSTGERTGVVVKLSKKGMIWKTWEGEMNVGSMSSGGQGMAVPTVFRFSVKDIAVVEKIKKAATLGERITISYTQALVRPLKDGETQYLIEDVKK